MLHFGVNLAEESSVNQYHGFSNKGMVNWVEDQTKGKLKTTVTQPNSPAVIGGSLSSFNTISKTVQITQKRQYLVSMKYSAK